MEKDGVKGKTFGKGADLGPGRRRFLGAGCALCAGAMAPGGAGAARSRGKLRLRVVYALHSARQDRADWPNIGFDFRPVMERYNTALRNAFPETEFIPATASGPLQAKRILMEDAFTGVDGYIVFQMNAWNMVVQPIAASAKPVLFADFKYGGSGGFLVYNSIFMSARAGNVGFLSSSKMEDLVAAVECFKAIKNGGRAFDFGEAVARSRRARTPGPGDLSSFSDPVPRVSVEDALAKMRESKILAVGYPGVSFFALPMIGMRMVSFAELGAAGRAADRDQAREIARGWREGAARVEDVSEATLEDSAALYLGMKALLKRHRANAITVNCLQGFKAGLLQEYPCMGFHELCNQGLVGACECDVRSAGTMLAVNALTGGRPGYISDPVLDTAERRIIYAHCVASNRPFGPEGPANPFEILTHSEDRKGASVRSLLPAGYMTTSLEFAPEKRQVLVHQAKTTGNDPDDRACRTKLVAEPVGEFEKLFTMWGKWGWHRVTVYGDVLEPVSALADAIGYKVVRET